jgi:hypothetical protein
MYQLSDFIPFKGNEYKVTNGSHPVLAWSKKSGYYFTEVDFTKSELCVDVLIVAIEEV